MSKQTTTKPELSTTSIEDLLPGNNQDKAQRVIAEMRKEFTDLAMKNQELILSKKDVEMQLKKHPTMIAYANLKKEIRQNKKKLEQLSAIYQGGLKFAEKLGIKIDTSVMKMLIN